MRYRLVLAFAAVVMVLVAIAEPASAFCRKTTAGGDEAYDATLSGRCLGHDAAALPLFWGRSCIALRIVVDPKLAIGDKMTLARASSIVQRASATWSATQCGGVRSEALSIHIVDTAVEACPDGSVSEIHFTAAPPEDKGLLATTDLVFDANTGAISRGRTSVRNVYATLGEGSLEELDARVEGIVRHEMGHLLGLAHSQDERSVMFAGYDPNRSDGLTKDDQAGICDLYDPARPIGAGCHLPPPPSGGVTSRVPFVVIVLGCLLSLRRRRRLARIAGIVALLTGVLHVSIADAKAPKRPSRPKARPDKVGVPSARDRALIEETEPSLSGPEDETKHAGAMPRVAMSAPVPPPRDEHERDAPAAPEVPTRRTSDLYVGARYRAFVMPRPLASVIAQTNRDLLFHSASIQGDFRKESFSIVPALSFADLSTGDLLVGSKGNDLASSFSYVKSDLKAVAASVAFAWSWSLSRTFSFELGLELGVGVTFGSLHDTWVYETPNGPLVYDGRRFAPCTSVSDGFGCRPQDHASPNPVRVGDYRERSFFEGGKAPTLLPWVSLPLVGVRARLGEDIAGRIGIGASFTGVWAGMSLEYAVAKASR